MEKEKLIKIINKKKNTTYQEEYINTLSNCTPTAATAANGRCLLKDGKAFVYHQWDLLLFWCEHACITGSVRTRTRTIFCRFLSSSGAWKHPEHVSQKNSNLSKSTFLSPRIRQLPFPFWNFWVLGHEPRLYFRALRRGWAMNWWACLRCMHVGLTKWEWPTLVDKAESFQCCPENFANQSTIEGVQKSVTLTTYSFMYHLWEKNSKSKKIQG